jgi:hypothetical protein
LSAVALLLAAALAAAGDTGVEVTGRVRNAVTSQAIPGATVTAGEARAVTDAEGRFALQLPPGKYAAEASAPGFLPERFEFTAAATATLEIALRPSSSFREEIDVTARAGDDEQPSLLPLRPVEVTAMAGSADNVFRVIQTLPGVAATEEFGSRLSVRGGGPDQNLTVMDGVEIHDPFRLFGLVSAFNPETVQSFELTSGAFDVRHGDRLSSLLVVENRPGNAAKTLAGSLAASLTDANLVLEGKLPGGAPGSWLLTGRRTYYDLVAERFVDENLPSFDDLQFKAVWEPSPGQRLTLLGLRSREAADAAFTGDPGESGSFVGNAKNDLAALSFRTGLGGRGSSSTVLAWYRHADAFDVVARFRSQSQRSNTPGDDAFAFQYANFEREIGLRDVSLRQELTWILGPTTVAEGGFEVHLLDTSLSFANRGDVNEEVANGGSVRGGAGLPRALDSARDASRAGAWLMGRFGAGTAFGLEPGLRLDWSGVNGRAILQPRLQAAWRPGPVRVRLGVGLYAQSPGYDKLLQSDYLVDLSGAGRLDLDHERAFHAVAGVERDLGPGMLARVEVYWKSFDRLLTGRLETEAETEARVARYDFPPDLASSVPTEPIITSNPTNDGTGRAYGFDVFLSRRATSAGERLTGWASYTYGVAARDAWGRVYPFDYDRRHALSLVASWRLARAWDIAATLRVATGFPRTPVLGLRVAATQDLADSDGDGNRAELVPDRDAGGNLVWTTDLGGVANLNTARLPLFARLDARLTFSKGRWQVYLDVINVLNRENAGSIDEQLEYDPTSDRPRMVQARRGSIPFLPSFGLRFRL